MCCTYPPILLCSYYSVCVSYKCGLPHSTYMSMTVCNLLCFCADVRFPSYPEAIFGEMEGDLQLVYDFITLQYIHACKELNVASHTHIAPLGCFGTPE